MVSEFVVDEARARGGDEQNESAEKDLWFNVSI
jgi:hypothetical protein